MKTDTPKRESFVFYRSFQEAINKCPEDVQIILYRAVTDYALDLVTPDFSGVGDQQFVEAIWTLIKPQIDANHQRFLNGCKGGEYGKLGGAPKGNQNARKKQPQNNPKTTRNVNENGNVNENENENGLIEQTESKRDNKRKTSDSDLFNDVDKRREKRRKTNASKVEDDPLILPYDTKEFVDTWNELIKQPKWRNKPKSALKLALKQLSDYGPEYSVILMENSIAGNYQGVVFPDTPARYRQWRLSYPQWKRERVQSESRNTEKVITSIDEIYPD